MAVTSQDKDSPFFSASEVSRSVKVVVVAELSDVSIQVVDAPEEEDQELAYKVSYPDKVPDTLRGNQLQHVLVSFRVRSQGRPLPVQQAFVVLRHEMSGHEAILTAHLTGNKYKIHLVTRPSVPAIAHLIFPHHNSVSCCVGHRCQGCTGFQ